ncbi:MULTISPECIES: DotU family type IV/VI secretion system protein [unclassified Caballeronia]|uniref:DotU family type IV/VI secretion system protein n=1 Tax=unclassified Caballeronia TaxID=2646786 RepID=UPI002854E6E9|nr:MULTISPECIES: DotU family type IV/VI secretion system protein [unclassified Caballeronia]MDR5821695.1 DotU family type IV/VI secretion system protein [Caballeronia sp. LZ043]MDR5880067.1 DotU family type IV/VI secretion system protein [Caballeronia sp. LZ032]
MARNRPEPEEDDVVTEQFRTFLDELVKAQARLSELPDADPDLAAQGMSRHLINLLEIQTLQSRRDTTRFEMETVSDARYLKAVLADELLLNTPWAGQERWTAYLLESTLFRTNVAGDLVFRRIEQLLSDREPSRRNIARLYLFTLAMGFQGRFRGTDAAARLRSYREELYEFVYQRRADLGGRDRVLSEAAYANTLSHVAPRKLPTVSRWAVIVMLAAVSLLAVSELLWLWQSWPVREALHADPVAGVSQ